MSTHYYNSICLNTTAANIQLNSEKKTEMHGNRMKNLSKRNETTVISREYHSILSIRYATELTQCTAKLL